MINTTNIANVTTKIIGVTISATATINNSTVTKAAAFQTNFFSYITLVSSLLKLY